MCISYYQIVTQLAQVTAFVQPPAFRALLRVFDVSNLLVGWVPGLNLRCFGMPTLQASLLFELLTPLLVALALAAALRARARRYILLLTFLVSPAIQSRGFRVQAACDCFSNGDGAPDTCLLREDYSVQCDASSGVAPADIRMLGWLSVLTYGVAPIAVQGWLLYTARHAIRGHGALTPLSVDLSLLHQGYRPSAFWFEIVEGSRKIAMTGLLSLVYPGTVLQLYLGILVAFSLLILQPWCAPYRASSDNFFAVVSAAALAFVLLAELGLRAEALADAPRRAWRSSSPPSARPRASTSPSPSPTLATASRAAAARRASCGGSRTAPSWRRRRCVPTSRRRATSSSATSGRTAKTRRDRSRSSSAARARGSGSGWTWTT